MIAPYIQNSLRIKNTLFMLVSTVFRRDYQAGLRPLNGKAAPCRPSLGEPKIVDDPALGLARTSKAEFAL